MYHASDCPSLEDKSAANFSQFLTAEAAAASGFYPHSACMAEDAPAPEASHAFVASVLSDTYHINGCRFAEKINPENILYFESNAEAESKGYVPCNCCMG